MKSIKLGIALSAIVLMTSCRNTTNPNDTGGSDQDVPSRGAYDSGHEPSNLSNTAVTDSTENDSTDN
ncbi:MAG: hypothetical protein WA913_00530 [Pricia sp.]